MKNISNFLRNDACASEGLIIEENALWNPLERKWGDLFAVFFDSCSRQFKGCVFQTSSGSAGGLRRLAAFAVKLSAASLLSSIFPQTKVTWILRITSRAILLVFKWLSSVWEQRRLKKEERIFSGTARTRLKWCLWILIYLRRKHPTFATARILWRSHEKLPVLGSSWMNWWTLRYLSSMTMVTDGDLKNVFLAPSDL